MQAIWNEEKNTYDYNFTEKEQGLILYALVHVADTQADGECNRLYEEFNAQHNKVV